MECCGGVFPFAGIHLRRVCSSTMQAEFRYATKGQGRALLAVAVVFTSAFLYSSIEVGVRPKELMAGGPMFFLLFYGALLLAVNRSEVSVSTDGVDVRHRPLWAGVRDWRVPRADIAFTLWRYVVIPKRFGSESGYVAGLETRNGQWKDLTGIYEREQDARQMAEEMANLLGVSAVPRAGMPRKPDWNTAMITIAWGGAFIVALINGMLVEIYYPYR